MSEIEQQPIPTSELEKEVNKEVVIRTLRDAVLRDADDNDPAMPFFLGTLKEPHERIYSTARVYLGWQDAMNAGNERQANILKTRFEELRKEHFNDVDDFELSVMLTNYFKFFFRSLDRGMVRDDNLNLLSDKNFTNTLPGRGNTRIGLINAMKPSVDAKMSVRDKMRRNFLQAYGDPDSFNMVLLNSLIFMKVKIPTPMDLIRLINDITTKLRQYGERYQVSSLHLERAGIGQLIVDFVLDRATYWSVKDIDDPRELKELISTADLNHIAQTLLATSAPRGIVFRMYCLANQCNHSANKVIDPTTMALTVEEDMSEERRDVLMKITTSNHKLSREELAKLKPTYKDKDGQPLDLNVEMKGGIGRLVISAPTLSEYFSCYERMTARINPALRDLAVEFPNQKIYNEKRKEYISTLRMGEYLQWFSAYVSYPTPGTEGENETITRDEDPEEFELGLIDIFNKDEELYMDALSKVIQVAPRLTYTFIGIMEDSCPACAKKASGPTSEQLPGFTPIDPILNFFDHTRMMISIRASQASIEEDALS